MGGAWRRLSDEEWDAVAAESPGATAFHARGWARAIAAWQPRFEAQALGFTLADGEDVALPLLARAGAVRRGPLARAEASPPGVYGGPIARGRLLTEDDWREVLSALECAPLGRLDCNGNILQPLPAAEAARLRVRERHTHLIDLASLPVAARDAYRPACRRAVRKAERERVAVARARGDEDARAYVEIYRQSLARWGRKPEEGHSAALIEALARTPPFELWCARAPDGRLAAGGLFGFARRHAVYWHGALCEELADLRPANALHDALIEEARRRGCALYDFNPSGGLAGVEEFKESFGARRAPFLAWRHVRPLLGLLGRRPRRAALGRAPAEGS